MKGKDNFSGISSFALHLLAMALMLCDHLWATVLSGEEWLTWAGRAAFPIFAFLLTEGFYHTSDLKKYRRRMFFFAVISEIPFNLMCGGSVVYPFHQNVMWTFWIALICMGFIEKVKKKKKIWLTAVTFAGVSLIGYVIGFAAMTDYFGYGVLTVLLFYLFRGRKWYHFLGQAAGLYWINVVMIKGLNVPVMIAGREVFIAQQAMALLALIPIWLYRGKQGPHSKTVKYCFYTFYPVHMLVLALAALLG